MDIKKELKIKKNQKSLITSLTKVFAVFTCIGKSTKDQKENCLHSIQLYLHVQSFGALAVLYAVL